MAELRAITVGNRRRSRAVRALAALCAAGDCLWPTRRVAVELDGRQHERPRQAARDDDRDLSLRRHGYIPRRYGERQVTHRADDVIADLEDAFAEAVELGRA